MVRNDAICHVIKVGSRGNGRKSKSGIARPTKGAAECMDAIFPHVLHVFKVIEGKRHD